MLCKSPAIWTTLPYKMVSKWMYLVDLVEMTLEFAEALLYQLTLSIRLPNLSQRATQCTVCLNYRNGSISFKIQEFAYMICVTFKVYILFLVENARIYLHLRNRSTDGIWKLTEFANNTMLLNLVLLARNAILRQAYVSISAVRYFLKSERLQTRKKKYITFTKSSSEKTKTK